VTLAELKAHARIDHTDEDAYLLSLLELATDYAKDRTRRSFIGCRYEMKLDVFPAWHIMLPRPPMAPTGLVEITYTNENSQTVTVPSHTYRVDRDSVPGRLFPLYNGSWPTGLLDEEGAVTVRWDAGYGDAAAVPRKAKHLILMYANHWYMNREPAGSGALQTIPLGAEALAAHLSWGQYDG
jgi:uncharacterized phiE125 gp8 family phage protein